MSAMGFRQGFQLGGVVGRHERGEAEREAERARAMTDIGSEGPKVALGERPGLRAEQPAVLAAALPRPTDEMDHRKPVADIQPPFARDLGLWPWIHGLSRRGMAKNSRRDQKGDGRQQSG